MIVQTDLIHVPIWNLLSVPIFRVVFYHVTFYTTATLPEITHYINKKSDVICISEITRT